MSGLMLAITCISSKLRSAKCANEEFVIFLNVVKFHERKEKRKGMKMLSRL